MAKHTPEGKARNKALYTSFKKYQEMIDTDVQQVKDITSKALQDGGITEETIDLLAGVFRGYEYIKPIADEAWERYENHCTMFDYEIKY
jgi:hypothetical protein